MSESNFEPKQVIHQYEKIINSLKQEFDLSIEEDNDTLKVKISEFTNSNVDLRNELKRISKKIKNKENQDEDLEKHYNTLLKNFVENSKTFIDLLNYKIDINENAIILMNQLRGITRLEALELLYKHNNNMTEAILSHNKIETAPDVKTYFDFQFNQHTLVNELINLSIDEKLDFTPPLNTSTDENIATLSKTQSYVCIIISDDTTKKIKKYSTMTELYNTFISPDTESLSVVKININNESFALFYNENNMINASILNNSRGPVFSVNKQMTVLLRKLNIIDQSKLYTGPALFTNNCFLN